MHIFGKIAMLLCLPVLVAACGQRAMSFTRDVNPILQSNCAVCHAPGEPGYEASGFSVASYQDVMKGTRYGPVVAPGSSVGSTMVRLIRHQADPSINMPRTYSVELEQKHEHIVLGKGARSLTDHEIDIVAHWIDQGAKDN